MRACHQWQCAKADAGSFTKDPPSELLTMLTMHDYAVPSPFCLCCPILQMPDPSVASPFADSYYSSDGELSMQDIVLTETTTLLKLFLAGDSVSLPAASLQPPCGLPAAVLVTPPCALPDGGATFESLMGKWAADLGETNR